MAWPVPYLGTFKVLLEIFQRSFQESLSGPAAVLSAPRPIVLHPPHWCCTQEDETFSRHMEDYTAVTVQICGQFELIRFYIQ